MATELLPTALAASASLLAAVSALASWRATRAVEHGVSLAQATTRYELFRSLELDYEASYESIWSRLGPWDDPIKVDPDDRRAVHALLRPVSSVYVAQRAGLMQADQAEYLGELFLCWLRLPKARAIWDSVFAVQADSWPVGFVTWLNAELDRH